MPSMMEEVFKMLKKVTLTVIALGSALAISAPAFAQSANPLVDKDLRLLRLDAGVCDSSKQAMVNWAAKIDGHGSYAVPAYPVGVDVDCGSSSNVLPIGQSFGFSDQKAADIAALNQCQATLPSGFDRCVIIGQSYKK
jgi:hypothetical protein